MNELINVNYDESTERQIVSGRELHEALEIETPYHKWFPRMCEYGFSELVGDLAKLLKQNGVDIGQKRLFEYLRNNGYLIKTGSSINMPTQRSMELKLFEVKERTISNPDGTVRITKTTKVTGKGQEYFIAKFLRG